MSDTTTITSADVKRAVIHGGGCLFVNLIGDQPYMTDSYWLAPITNHFASFAKTYGISTEPASYMVDNAKTAHRNETVPPAFDRLLEPGWDKVGLGLEVAGWVELHPHLVDKIGPVFITPDTPALVLSTSDAAGYRDGQDLTALSVRYLRVIGGVIGFGLGKEPLETSVRLAKSWNADGYRIRVFGLAGKTQTKHCVVVVYRESRATSAGTYKVTKSWVEQSRALLMPVRIGAQR